MPVSRIQVTNYRSLRDFTLDLSTVTILVGANGCGKTNTYRALGLLHAAAQGRLADTFAAEGGIASMTWSGLAKRKDEIRQVRIAVEVVFDRYVYRFACGVPLPKPSLFSLNPEVKEEFLGAWVPGRKTPVPLCERQGHIITVRDENGARHTLTDPLDPTESMLVQLVDPERHPELILARSILAGWRFHHQFRTDPDSPLRKPALAVQAPVLSHDGANLAATLQTIIEMGAGDRLHAAIAQAFPGCAIHIRPITGNRLNLTWSRPDLSRELSADELSDGTLRFLALAAALLTPRPPTLLVLNEPEAGLHVEVIPALAGLIASASERGQVVVTTHLGLLADSIRGHAPSNGGAAEVVELCLAKGETCHADDIAEDGGRRFRLARSTRG